MSRPLIQIDNAGNSREMTEEEHATHKALWEQCLQNAADMNTTTENVLPDETPGAS